MSQKEIPLHVLNLCAKGKTPDEAWAIYNNKPPKTESGNDGKPVKLSASEKKEAIAEKINALGGEVPDSNASVAKFEQALSAAESVDKDNDVDGLM